MSLQGLYTYSFIVTASKAYQYLEACLLLAFYIILHITIIIISISWVPNTQTAPK